jgi:hypothetical protein
MANIFLSQQEGSRANSGLYNSNQNLVANTYTFLSGNANISTGNLNPNSSAIQFIPGLNGNVATISVANGVSGNANLLIQNTRAPAVYNFNSPVVVDQDLRIDNTNYTFTQVGANIIDASSMTTNLPIGQSRPNINATISSNTSVVVKTPNYYRGRMSSVQPVVPHATWQILYYDKIEGVDFLTPITGSGATVAWRNDTGRTMTLDITATVMFRASGGGTKKASILKNGDLVHGQIGQEGLTWTDNLPTYLNFGTILTLSPSDYFGAYVWQNNNDGVGVPITDGWSFNSVGQGTQWVPGRACAQISFIELW